MRKLPQIIAGCIVSCVIVGTIVFTKHNIVTDIEAPITTDELFSRQKEEFVNALGYADNGEGYKSRLKRDSGTSPFDLIAGISGGSVIHTDKDNITSAIDLLTSRLANQVILLRVQRKANTTTQFTFNVDESVTKLGVKTTTSCCKPTITIQDPAGNIYVKSSPHVTVTVDTTTTLYELINGTITKGKWTVTINDSHTQDYDVTIYGSSLVSYSTDFCDSMGNIVSGQPISDSNQTYIKLTPSGFSLTSNWTYFILKTINGTTLQRLPFGELKGSRRNKEYLLQVKWPNMDVHVGVQGLDKSGNIFTRESETLIQPLGVRLHLDNTDIGYITSCNTPTRLTFSVTNLLKTPERITCQIMSSNPKFEASVTPKELLIGSLQTKNATAIIKLTSTPFPAESTDVLITALTSDKKAQYLTKTLVTRNVKCDTVTIGYELSTGSFEVTSVSDKTVIITTASGTRSIQSSVSVIVAIYFLHFLTILL